MPDPLASRLQQAVALMNAGKYDEAEPILLDLRTRKPLDPFICYNLGNVYVEQRRFQESARLFRQAIAAAPNLIPALVNLSSSLLEIGDRPEALRYVQMALRRQPDDYKLLTNLSIILLGLGEAPDALAAIERAVQFAPKEYNVLRQWACCLSDLGRWKDAIGVCKRAIEAAGDRETAVMHGMLFAGLSRYSMWTEIPPIVDRLCKWSDIPGGTGIVPMTIAFFADSPEKMLEVARGIAPNVSIHRRPPLKPKQGPITVAYFSPDFREHPVAHMVLDVLRSHDRTAFRIFTLGSVPLEKHGLGLEISRLAESHLDLSMLSDDAAANQIRAMGIDILVDLAGSTLWSRPGVLARRPSPIQLLWLGCPATTGMPWYDGYLIDEVVAPQGAERFITEPVYRLSCCYHPISSGWHPPVPELTRTQMELPEDAFLLGVRLQPTKVIPPFTDDLVEIMRRCPQAHLWIKVEPASEQLVADFFAERGIDRQRIITRSSFIRERERYLAAFKLADLLLDGYPYGGHSTTGEALSVGCPVVTQAGRSIHTRVAASMLHELGLDDLVANSRQEYVELVCRLVHDPARLADVRARTRAAAQALHRQGATRLAGALETAYREYYASAPRDA